ncbi:MAG: hypothetical protein CSA47_02370 [Gammaproteobacteria bacterium]|nr:MAG: hypothetical protein CSA47_02370 [Gammaproteobacteria bacterium]
MAFPEQERKQLLTAKFVGETVVSRLEEMGIHSLAQLAETPAETILAQGAEITGSTCWRNSPQAKKAVAHAIAWAIRSTGKE